MAGKEDVFDRNYQDYLAQLEKVDIEAVKERLGLISDAGKLCLPFFNKKFLITNTGFVDEAGNIPSYGESVPLFKYILLCPNETKLDEGWAAFQDFKLVSHFTNVNFFKTDTEKAIEGAFSGKLDNLKKACAVLGGFSHETEMKYDVSMRFEAFPRISLLLLFNDGDEEFSAKCTVLFQKQAEYYLDPESLAITSSWLAKRLVKQLS